MKIKNVCIVLQKYQVSVLHSAARIVYPLFMSMDINSYEIQLLNVNIR